LDAPIKVTRTREQLQLCSRLAPEFSHALVVPKLWFCEIRAGTECAFREFGPMTLDRSSSTAALTVPSTFTLSDFSSANLLKLRSRMHQQLMQEGLFADEASALLNTWQLSYFQSPGQRLFFSVPAEWTDHYLPLRFSCPVEKTRMMIGRIELVSPDQRRILRELENSEAVRKPWAHLEVVDGKAVFRGAMPVWYSQLGRFRNTLILEEEKRNPTAPLEQFIRINGLEASPTSF
jgi:hypothetical protein